MSGTACDRCDAFAHASSGNACETIFPPPLAQPGGRQPCVADGIATVWSDTVIETRQVLWPSVLSQRPFLCLAQTRADFFARPHDACSPQGSCSRVESRGFRMKSSWLMQIRRTLEAAARLLE